MNLNSYHKIILPSFFKPAALFVRAYVKMCIPDKRQDRVDVVELPGNYKSAVTAKYYTVHLVCNASI